MEEVSKDELSELGRKLAASRTIKVAKCEWCGTEFSGLKKKRFCSNKCRVAGYRAERKKLQVELQTGAGGDANN